jgi:DNA adenine methylase
MIKPIIKWVGGKTQILDKVLSKFPTHLNNYHEIFLGGGSVLFGLLEFRKDGKIKIDGHIYAYDINETLISMYKNIQNHKEELYEVISKMSQQYENITELNGSRTVNNHEEAISSKESYYYWIRSYYNKLTQEEKNTPAGSAILIFLNKTGFRGLYRVSSNGYNVPFGNYKNPEILNYDHLKKLSDLIQCVKFIHSDFTESLSLKNNLTLQSNDFVYLDPPYAPESSTSFVGYTKDGFCLEQHINLFSICNSLKDKDVKFVLSNANVKLVTDSFDSKYFIEIITCKRSINSKNPESKTDEVLISNF